MAQKYYKELSNKILVQKEAKKERQGNDVAHLLLPNLVLHLDEGKRLARSKVKKKIKKSEGEDLLVCLRAHRLLIP